MFTTDVRNGKLQSASGGAPNAVRDRTFAVPNWCTESVVEWVSKQERKTGCKVQSETLNGRYVGGPTRFPPRRMVSQASAMDNSCDVKKYLRPAFDHIFRVADGKVRKDKGRNKDDEDDDKENDNKALNMKMVSLLLKLKCILH